MKNVFNLFQLIITVPIVIFASFLLLILFSMGIIGQQITKLLIWRSEYAKMGRTI